MTTNPTRKKRKRTGTQKKTSKYRGVALDKRNGDKWVAYVWHDRSRVYVGYFDDEVTAAQAVNWKCNELGINQYNPSVEAVAPELNRIRKQKGQPKKRRKKRQNKIDNNDVKMPPRKIRKLAKDQNASTSQHIKSKSLCSKSKSKRKLKVKKEHKQHNYSHNINSFKVDDDEDFNILCQQDEDFVPADLEDSGTHFARSHYMERQYQTRSSTRRSKPAYHIDYMQRIDEISFDHLPRLEKEEEIEEEENVVELEISNEHQHHSLKLEPDELELLERRQEYQVEKLDRQIVYKVKSESDEYQPTEDYEDVFLDEAEESEDNDDEDDNYDPTMELEEEYDSRMKSQSPAEEYVIEIKKRNRHNSNHTVNRTSETRHFEQRESTRKPITLKLKLERKASDNVENTNVVVKDKVSPKAMESKKFVKKKSSDCQFKKTKKKKKTKRKKKKKNKEIITSGCYVADFDDEESEDVVVNLTKQAMKEPRPTIAKKEPVSLSARNELLVKVEASVNPTSIESPALSALHEPNMMNSPSEMESDSTDLSIFDESMKSPSTAYFNQTSESRNAAGEQTRETMEDQILYKPKYDAQDSDDENMFDSNNFSDKLDNPLDRQRFFDLEDIMMNSSHSTSDHKKQASDAAPNSTDEIDFESDIAFASMFAQSLKNSKKKKEGESKGEQGPPEQIELKPNYNGVEWDNKNRRWEAVVNFNGENFTIGHFQHEVWAAQMVNGFCDHFNMPLLNPGLPCIVPDEKVLHGLNSSMPEQSSATFDDFLVSESEDEIEF